MEQRTDPRAGRAPAQSDAPADASAAAEPGGMAQAPGRRPLLVLLNPCARSALAGTVAADVIARRLRELGAEVTVVVTASADEARRRAAGALAGPWRAVVAAGGDGTVHGVVAGLVEGRTRAREGGRAAPGGPALGILPLGTMNNVAHSLGIPEDLAAACAVLVSARPRPLDVGLIGGHPFVEAAGVGLEAQLVPWGEAAKGHVLLHPGIILDVLRQFNAFQPARLRLVADGRAFQVRALQITVCNAPRYGLDLAAAPDARLDDGLLDVVIYRRFSRWELARHYLSIMGGRRVPRPRERHLRARRLRMATAGRPWPVHADGLPAGITPVEAEVLPGALRVLAPPAAAATPDPIGPLELLLRAAAPPATSAAAHAAFAAAEAAAESLAQTGETVLQAFESGAEEAREAVGVEPPRRSARRAALLSAAYLAGLAGASITTLAVRRMNLLPGDLQLTRAVQRRRTPARDAFWRLVAAPGFPALSTPLVGGSIAAFLALRLPVEAGFMLLASGTNLANFVLKRTVRRQRPTHELVHVARVINEPGFPSGHVMHYLSFYGFLAAAALANLRPSRLRRAIVGACLAMIGLVGPSRVYLGAHWPSDVAAGYLYGGLYLGALLEAYARVKRRASARPATRGPARP